MRFHAIVLLCAAVGLSACGSSDEEAAANAPPKLTPKPPGAAAKDEGGEAGEAAAEDDDYVYNPIGKRDPFRSFLTFGKRSAEDTPRTPLQKYELDQYQLVGIVWGVERPRALVEDPEGVGHVVEIGTYIGRNWGRVTKITEDAVTVTEEYQTPEGELVVNNINLTLAPLEE